MQHEQYSFHLLRYSIFFISIWGNNFRSGNYFKVSKFDVVILTIFWKKGETIQGSVLVFTKKLASIEKLKSKYENAGSNYFHYSATSLISILSEGQTTVEFLAHFQRIPPIFLKNPDIISKSSSFSSRNASRIPIKIPMEFFEKTTSDIEQFRVCIKALCSLHKANPLQIFLPPDHGHTKAKSLILCGPNSYHSPEICI